MSSKIRTRTTPVPDQTAEDKLRAALRANPNTTAAHLSTAAKIGKSTAQKILANWAGEGSAVRTPGITEGGRRAADSWVIAESSTANIPDTADECLDTATHDAPTDQDHTTIAADATPSEENATESANAEPATISADGAPASTEATNNGNGAAPAADATQVASGDAKAERLAPGALRGSVEDHLRDHPDDQFGPTAIAKALGGKSSGAVSNALDKLVEHGVAVKTQDKPKRFALAPAEQAPAH